jgi:hypothetical protein
MNCPKCAVLLVVGLFAFIAPYTLATISVPDESAVQVVDTGGHSAGSVDVTTNQYTLVGTGFGGNSSEVCLAGGTATSGDAAVIVHYQSTDFPATSFFDVFVEVSIPTTTPLGGVKIQLTNDSTQTQTISNAGYFFTPTEIPLDNLNPTNDPPSDFTTIPGLDTTTQGASQVDSATVLPEPASALTLAAAALFLIRRRRAIVR